MNKTEIQERITKVESELATLKADLAKCDCAEGIEQEECWFGVTVIGDCVSSMRRTKEECKSHVGPSYRPAYMPECRQVTEDDAIDISVKVWGRATTLARELAAALHEAGFRIKVTP